MLFFSPFLVTAGSVKKAFVNDIIRAQTNVCFALFWALKTFFYKKCLISARMDKQDKRTRASTGIRKKGKVRIFSRRRRRICCSGEVSEDLVSKIFVLNACSIILFTANIQIFK